MLDVKHPILDHMVGRWILRGTIAHRSVVHDVEAAWELAHHYVRVHEVTREKNSAGQPEYEAMVFIGWNEDSKNYGCIWLDVAGGLSTLSIGTAPSSESELAFSFRNEKDEVDLTNKFAYFRQDDAWEWWIDNVEKGVPKEFARVRLTRS